MKKNIAILTIIMSMLMVTAAMAKNTVVIEGYFKGALCSYCGKDHPQKLTRAQIAIEPDFVLRDVNGNDYFISNLPRWTKARYLNQQVRISGTFDDEGTFCAQLLKVYQGKKVVTVWDFEKIKKAQSRDIK